MVLDIIVIAILAICVIIGVFRGAAKTLLNLAGYIIAFFTAAFCSSFVADWIYGTFVRDGIIDKITIAIEQTSTQSISVQVQKIIEELPRFLPKAMLESGKDINKICSSVLQNTPNTAAEAIEGTVAPFITSIILVFVAVILFIIALIGLKMIIRIVNNAFKLPVIKRVNAVLGGILGFIIGRLIILFIVYILKAGFENIDSVSKFVTDETINNSFIFKLFYNGNIVMWIENIL